jgi:hypothetical protein
MITIYTLHFDDARSAEAHAANAAIIDELGRAGFPLYRGGINVSSAKAGPIATRLKEALDPMGIISPGRYEP